MSIPALREFLARHSAASLGIAALGAAIDAKVSGTPIPERLRSSIDGLLGALGQERGGAALLDDVSPQELAPLLAQIRSDQALEANLTAGGHATSYAFTDPRILTNLGGTSAGFVGPLSRVIVPSLAGLAERLSKPGATFLDVGVGVAGLAIAAARTWPELRVVGIDPWQPSLALGRENVKSANLEKRIELREQRAEDLVDENFFDLAWIPAVFMPEATLKLACERVLRSLRPGGWMLFNAIEQLGDPLMDATWRLRLAMFGGTALSPQDAEALLRDAGYDEVQTLCGPPGVALRLVAGRKKS